MATSVVQICNQALAHMGTTKQIAALTEASKEARVCNLMFNKVRDFLMRRHWWSFNKAWTTVGALTTEHPYWTYVYQYPSDCLNVRRIMSTSQNPLQWKKTDSIPHEVAYSSADAARVILTNEESAYVEYSARISDPNLWDVGFVDAMGWSLAVATAMPLSGKPAVQRSVLEGWTTVLRDALAADANEDNITLDYEAEWLTARQG